MFFCGLRDLYTLTPRSCAALRQSGCLCFPIFLCQMHEMVSTRCLSLWIRLVGCTYHSISLEYTLYTFQFECDITPKCYLVSYWCHYDDHNYEILHIISLIIPINTTMMQLTLGFAWKTICMNIQLGVQKMIIATSLFKKEEKFTRGVYIVDILVICGPWLNKSN